MDDQDLGGEDLKYVSYSILFTKRDFETTLQDKQTELVAYPTDPGSYGGLKIAKFLVKLAKGIQRPPEWKDPEYPPSEFMIGNLVTGIPQEDEQYIVFDYKVSRRIERNATDYDKQKVKALKEIAKASKEIAGIG